MKKLNVSWNDTFDSTGYLFSFAKSLSTAVNHSPFKDLSLEIVASSGFAFRMWLNTDLCPSAMSIWDFSKQPEWLLNGGLESSFVSCCWQPSEIINKERQAILPKIKESIDKEIPVIAWDIGVLEWGLITGYNDETQTVSTLAINGNTDEMPYSKIGNREMPMLNVVTLTNSKPKNKNEIIKDTLKLAKSHLLGEEWCDEKNKKGLDVYNALIEIVDNDHSKLNSWNMEYYLGTYAALKWYAWKFFEKYNLSELCNIYKEVHENWQRAFELKKSLNPAETSNCEIIKKHLVNAFDLERKAIELM